MSKIIFITNLANKIGSFSIAGIEAAKNTEINFYMCANWQNTDLYQIKSFEEKYGIKIINLPISRNPFDKSNFLAYKQLVEFIKQEKIDYIHCNTPTGGILGRLAGKKCKVKKVIYQAHGFHFYKGAPKKNWLVYYPVEKWLAKYTDALITINKEDFELADKKFRLRNNGKVYYVAGVGIDTNEYLSDGKLRDEKRAELNLKASDIALISMGDLIERKNYETAVRAVAETKNKNIQYFICGKGPEEEKLKALCNSLNIENQVHFLGFRSDIKELLNVSDIFLFTTKQEGLPRSMMEAMASGLPCIASKIRGNTDLLENTDGGYLCESTDYKDFAEKINVLANDKQMRENAGKSNLITIQKFSTDTVSKEIKEIYSEEFCGGG